MSLINDALKRAKESQRSNPPSGARPLPPVERPPRGGNGWILGLAAILFLAAAGLFTGVVIFKHSAPPVKTATAPAIPTPKPPVQTAPQAKPVSPVQTVSSAKPAPQVHTVPQAKPILPAKPIPAPAPAPVSLPAPKVSPAVLVATPPPAAPVDQPLKIQGIIFNSTRPVAIVNGKTVGVGDRAGNFLVKQILKSSIVFQRTDGSQKTLNIGE